MATTTLKLDKDLQNVVFSNWRLGTPILEPKCAVDLPSHVYRNDSGATNYIHTRHSLLRNNLIISAGRMFVFLKDGITINLHQVDTASGVQLQYLAGERAAAVEGAPCQ